MPLHRAPSPQDVRLDVPALRVPSPAFRPDYDGRMHCTALPARQPLEAADLQTVHRLPRGAGMPA